MNRKITGPSDINSAPMTMRLRNLEPSTPVLRSAYSRNNVRIRTTTKATNSRNMSAESAAKISVSSLVSGSSRVSLNVAWAKMIANSRNVVIESAMTAGVRFFFVLLEGVADGINRLSSDCVLRTMAKLRAARGDSGVDGYYDPRSPSV